MLEEWLEPDSVNFFLKHHLCKRQPFTKPQAAQSSTRIFKRNTLDRLLANSAADTLAVSRVKQFPARLIFSCLSPRPALTDSAGIMTAKRFSSSRRRASKTISFAKIQSSSAKTRHQTLPDFATKYRRWAACV